MESKSLPALLVTKKGESGIVKYSGQLNYPNIKKFLLQQGTVKPKPEQQKSKDVQSVGRIQELTTSNFQTLCGDSVCVILSCKPSASPEKTMLTQV